MTLRKRLLVTLPGDVYQQLVRLAEQEERVIDQQASYLLKQAIAARSDHADTPVLPPRTPDVQSA